MNTSSWIGLTGVSLTYAYPHWSSARIFRRKLFVLFSTGTICDHELKPAFVGLSGIGIPLDTRQHQSPRKRCKLFLSLSPWLMHALPPNTRAKCMLQTQCAHKTNISQPPPIKYSLWWHLRPPKRLFCCLFVLGKICRSKWRTLVSCLAYYVF